MGSSRSSRSGRPRSANASATRRRSPPESCATTRSRDTAPTRVRISSTSWSRLQPTRSSLSWSVAARRSSCATTAASCARTRSVCHASAARAHAPTVSPGSRGSWWSTPVRPCTWTRPCVGGSSWASTWRSVDFPLPLTPTSPTCSPASTTRSAPPRTVRFPKTTSIPRATSTLMRRQLSPSPGIPGRIARTC